MKIRLVAAAIHLLFILLCLSAKGQSLYSLPKGIDSTLIIDSFINNTPKLIIINNEIGVKDAKIGNKIRITIKVNSKSRFPINIERLFVLDESIKFILIDSVINGYKEKNIRVDIIFSKTYSKLTREVILYYSSDKVNCKTNFKIKGNVVGYEQDEDSPVLSFYNTFVDFGNDFEYNQNYPFEFKFINSGHYSLKIINCKTNTDSVLSLNWPKEEIKSGKQGVITGIVKTGYGNRFRRYIEVESNAIDPVKDEKLILVIKGRKTK